MDYEQKDYTELLQLANDKLITLSEVGELPNVAILQAQPKWSWFLVWTNFIYDYNTKQQVNEIYNLPQILTHDEIKLQE